MDIFLRCAPALLSRSSIGFHSCPCLCPWLSICSNCLPCPRRRAIRVCCPVISLVLFHDAMVLTHSVPSCLLPCQPCTLSRRWRLLMTCRCSCPSHPVSSSRRTHRHSLVHWCRSLVGHHLVDDDLQLFHDFIELPRSRQELTFHVLRHHVVHHEYLLRLIDHFELFFGHETFAHGAM